MEEVSEDIVEAEDRTHSNREEDRTHSNREEDRTHSNREVQDLSNGPLETLTPMDPTTHIHRNGVSFLRSDLNCLASGEWLNCTVINVYIGLLKNTIGDEQFQASSFKPLVLTTYDTAKILSIMRTKVDLLSSAVMVANIHAYSTVFAPFHIMDTHWVLIEIDSRSKRLMVYDSLQNSATYITAVRYAALGFLTWYDTLTRARGEETLQSALDKWQQSLTAKCPQQVGGVDCGVFTIFALRSRLFKTLPYNQTNMLEMRNSIRSVIENNKFEHDDPFSPIY